MPRPSSLGTTALLLLATTTSTASPPPQYNVLLLYVDDLRTNRDGLELTPNQNGIAAAPTAFRFTDAVTSYPMCGPSRASMLSGRRPDSIRVWGNNDNFTTLNPSIETLPGAFKSAGWETRSFGKVYHPGCGTDNARSWSVPAWHAPFVKPHNHTWYAVPSSFPDDAPELLDGIVQRQTQALLAARSPGNRTQPFFIAAGFHRPHLPWIFPERFLAAYDNVSTMPLAQNPLRPIGSPECAEFTMGTLLNFDDWRAMCEDPSTGGPSSTPCSPFANASIPAGHPVTGARAMRRAYHAATSWSDFTIGETLKALRESGNEDSTIVVFVSDHGWKLGNKQSWEKQTLWDEDVTTPFIIKLPPALYAARIASGGDDEISATTISVPVEHVDLMPTLLDLANLTHTLSPSDRDGLAGTSLVPLMRAAHQKTLTATPRYAFAQVAHRYSGGKKPNAYPAPGWNGIAMGCMVYDGRFRYIEWPTVVDIAGNATKDFNNFAGSPEWYDHAIDPLENTNTYASAPPTDLTRMRAQLRRVYDVVPPPPPPGPGPGPKSENKTLYANGKLMHGWNLFAGQKGGHGTSPPFVLPAVTNATLPFRGHAESLYASLPAAKDTAVIHTKAANALMLAPFRAAKRGAEFRLAMLPGGDGKCAGVTIAFVGSGGKSTEPKPISKYLMKGKGKCSSKEWGQAGIPIADFANLPTDIEKIIFSRDGDEDGFDPSTNAATSWWFDSVKFVALK